MPFIFKASYDKANRTAGTSFRGPGLDEGLRILAGIKSKYDVPILTDIHEPSQARRAAEVADVLQIPAFLSRQTDLIAAAAATGRVVNIKKGQFLAPDDIRHAVAKAVAAGNPRVIVTERGTSFGYHNLVVDMRAFPMMRAQGVPVVFDVTHSLQLPGGGDGVTAGLGEYIEPLASAGVAAGSTASFSRCTTIPSRAKSDAQNALHLDRLEPLLRRLMAIDAIARNGDGSPTVHGDGSPTGDASPRNASMGDFTLARKVLETEAAAILALVDRLDERFERAVQLLRDCRGRVILTGMGKSGIICRKIAATLTSTGTPAFFLHPAEAIHGDLGVIQQRRCHPRAVVQRRDRRDPPAARDDSPPGREARGHHRHADLDARPGGRRGARLQRGRRGVSVEPRADGQHHGGARHRRRAGDDAPRRKGFPAGRLCEPASGRTNSASA